MDILLSRYISKTLDRDSGYPCRIVDILLSIHLLSRYISKTLDRDSGYPSHIVDILLSLKHHAEQDKQHFLTLQSYLASKVKDR